MTFTVTNGCLMDNFQFCVVAKTKISIFFNIFDMYVVHMKIKMCQNPAIICNSGLTLTYGDPRHLK